MSGEHRTGMAGRCPTACYPDCDTDCHELHEVPWKRKHKLWDCPGRKAQPETSAPDRVRAWVDSRTDEIDRDDVREVYVTADRVGRELAGAIGELRRAQAERDALAAQVAELSGELPACFDCDHWAASHYTGTETKTGCALCSCRRSVLEIQRKD